MERSGLRRPAVTMLVSCTRDSADIGGTKRLSSSLAVTVGVHRVVAVGARAARAVSCRALHVTLAGVGKLAPVPCCTAVVAGDSPTEMEPGEKLGCLGVTHIPLTRATAVLGVTGLPLGATLTTPAAHSGTDWRGVVPAAAACVGVPSRDALSLTRRGRKALPPSVGPWEAGSGGRLSWGFAWEVDRRAFGCSRLWRSARGAGFASEARGGSRVGFERRVVEDSIEEVRSKRFPVSRGATAADVRAGVFCTARGRRPHGGVVRPLTGVRFRPVRGCGLKGGGEGRRTDVLEPNCTLLVLMQERFASCLCRRAGTSLSRLPLRGTAGALRERRDPDECPVRVLLRWRGMRAPGPEDCVRNPVRWARAVTDRLNGARRDWSPVSF